MKLIACLFVVLWLGHAQASECIPRPPEQIAQNARTAFIGTVKAIENSSYKPSKSCWKALRSAPQCGGKLVTLEVSEQLRGDLSKTMTVVAEDACYCLGPYWKKGTQYLVIARSNAEEFQGQIVVDDQCGGTVEVTNEADPLIKALRSTKK